MIHKVPQETFIKGKQIAQIFDTRDKKADAIEKIIDQMCYTPVTSKDYVGWMIEFAKTQKLEYLKKAGEIHDKLWADRREEYLYYLSLLQKSWLVREYSVHNLIATAGRSVLAQRLANTLTYTGILNYGMLGSGLTAVANGDTQMTTEVFRKLSPTGSYTTNVAFVDFFYSKADTNGTYNEFGNTIDGTATINTGQLFTHVLTGGWTKTSSESMTVACQYTIN